MKTLQALVWLPKQTSHEILFFTDSCSVGEHANCSWHLGHVASWDNSWRLIIYANFEPGWTPIHKLNCSLVLNCRDGCVDVLWNDISSVKKTTSHVLAMTRVTFDHLVHGLKARVGDVRHRHALVVSLVHRQNGGVGDQREVDPGVGHQVGLELCQIDIEGSVESEGGSN